MLYLCTYTVGTHTRTTYDSTYIMLLVMEIRYAPIIMVYRCEDRYRYDHTTHYMTSL